MVDKRFHRGRSPFVYVEPTPELVGLIADTLRAADRAEMRALFDEPAARVLEACIVSSTVSWVGMFWNLPVGIVGIEAHEDLAHPWMFGTTAIARAPLAFLRETRWHVDLWRANFARLENYVHDRHDTAKRWLAWLGFTLDPPAPYGMRGEPFRRFWWERGAV